MILSITLEYLAGEKFNSVHKEHGIGKATFYAHLDIGLDAIIAALCIKFPCSEEECESASNGFKLVSRPGISGCIGVIDGIGIKIRPRSKEGSGKYLSRKGFHALNVQTVSDASKKCTYLCLKTPGRTNDARGWVNCGLYTNFKNGNLYQSQMRIRVVCMFGGCRLV